MINARTGGAMRAPPNQTYRIPYAERKLANEPGTPNSVSNSAGLPVTRLSAATGCPQKNALTGGMQLRTGGAMRAPPNQTYRIPYAERKLANEPGGNGKHTTGLPVTKLSAATRRLREMTLDYCFFCHDKKHFCVVKGHFCSFLISNIIG